MAFNILGALSVRGYLESLLITSDGNIVRGNMGSGTGTVAPYPGFWKIIIMGEVNSHFSMLN